MLVAEIEGMEQVDEMLGMVAIASRSTAAKMIKTVLENVQKEAVRITASEGSGRVYESDGQKHRASSPGEPPAYDSGNLNRKLADTSAVQVDSTKLEGTFGPRGVPYAIYLEYGTSKMAARPFMLRAFSRAYPRLEEMFRDELRVQLAGLGRNG